MTASSGTNEAQAYTYGTFLSSHKSGRWSRMARGEVSPAKTISSEVPRFSVLVVSFAPLFRVSEGPNCCSFRCTHLSSAVCSGQLAARGLRSAAPKLRRPWATLLTGYRPCCRSFDVAKWRGFEEVIKLEWLLMRGSA
jgi:hypothetical protein